MKETFVVFVLLLLAPSLSFARQGCPASAARGNRQPPLAIAEPRCLGGFTSNRDGKESIYVMRADGSSQIKVSRARQTIPGSCGLRVCKVIHFA